MRCYYEILGVARDSPLPEIKKAYHKLCLQYHPDKNNGYTNTTAQFQEVAAAYEILGDLEAKSKYDKQLRREEKGKRHEMELKLRKGAWEMDARRKKAQQDSFMRTWHKTQNMEDESQAEFDPERTYFGESFWSEFGPFESGTRSGIPSFKYASMPASNSEECCESAEEQPKQNSSSAACPSTFGESHQSFPKHPPAENSSKPSSKPRPRKSYAEFSASEIFPDFKDTTAKTDSKVGSRPASQPPAPRAPWRSPLNNDWQRASFRGGEASIPVMPTVSEDAEKRDSDNNQADPPENPRTTQNQNVGPENTKEEKIKKKEAHNLENTPSKSDSTTGKRATKRRKSDPSSRRFEAPEFSQAPQTTSEGIPINPQKSRSIPPGAQKPQGPEGLNYSFMFHYDESPRSRPDFQRKLPPKPSPLLRPKSVFQKARAMSYQKLDELCSKLMTKGSKAKKEAKLAAQRVTEDKNKENEPLQRQQSQRAGDHRPSKRNNGRKNNEGQMPGFPSKIADWRVATRREYATQRASFEHRRMKIENQLYEQHRILELNNFAAKSLAGDYRIREAKLRGIYMSGFFMTSSVFDAMDKDAELAKIEEDRAKAAKAAEHASSMIQLLKQKMREEKQHYTKAVHMARVQNSRNACRFLKENITLSPPSTCSPKQRELCLGIWESVGSISIEEALSGTADKTILENLLLYQQWIETKDSDRESQFSKLDFLHKNERQLEENDKSK